MSRRIGIVVLIVFGKFIIWTAVVRLFRYLFRTAVLIGVGLTQIGEFTYVFVQVAREAKLVNEDVYSATLAASLLTILLNAFLTRSAAEVVGPAARCLSPSPDKTFNHFRRTTIGSLWPCRDRACISSAIRLPRCCHLERILTGVGNA